MFFFLLALLFLINFIVSTLFVQVFSTLSVKVKLVNPSSSRLQHLITQMKWRLREGQGEAIYEVRIMGNLSLISGIFSSFRYYLTDILTLELAHFLFWLSYQWQIGFCRLASRMVVK